MTEPLQVSREIAVESALFRDVFDTENGARVLALLEEEVGRCSFVPGDPYYTSFNEGKRWLLLLIKDVLKLAEQPMVVVELEAEMV